MQRALSAMLPASLLLGLAWLAYGFATTNVTAADLGWAQAWPLIRFCFASTAGGMVLMAVFGRSVAPLVVAIGAFVVVGFGPAATMACAALLWFAYLLGELIHRRDSQETDLPARVLFRVALGLVVLALMLNIAIALPVHRPLVYGAVFVVLIVVRWRASLDLAVDLRTLRSMCRTRLGPGPAAVWLAIGVVICIQLTYAGLPERQHDALAVHLMVAQVVKSAGQWHFAPDFFAFSVQPLAADWFAAVMYVVAGENGAKLANYVFFLLAVGLVHALSLRFGAAAAAAAVLVLVSTPIAFLEADSIFVDNFLLMCVAAALALCGLWPNLSSRDRVLACAVLLGGLPTAKLHGVIVALTLVVLLAAKRGAHDATVVGTRVLLAGVAIIALGTVPYLIAFATSGNPVFPFFNALFKSPYFPVWNFTGVYPPDLAPSILHRLTFDTSKHFQATDGTFGFQTVVFLFPVLVAAALRPCFIVISALAMSIVLGLIVLGQTADARYFYPLMPALSIAIAHAVHRLQELGGRAFPGMGVVSAALVAALNFIYFPGAGSSLRQFQTAALVNMDARNALIAHAVPHRLVIEQVNMMHGARARLVMMGRAVGFPLLGTPIFVNWYMHNVFAGMSQAKNNSDVAQWLASLGATHLMMPVEGEQIWNEEVIRHYLATEAEPVAVIGNQALYRIREDAIFRTHLAQLRDWSKQPESGSVALPQNENLGYQTPTLSPEQRSIGVGIAAACDNDRGRIAIHVYWKMADGRVPVAEEVVWPCPNGTDQVVFKTFARPRGAAGATIYLIKLGEGAARIHEAAVSTTVITLPEPVPLFARDWSASPLWHYVDSARARRSD